MKKYIALTIGPVVKTLISAGKTRELWAASYMFSYLMREILKEVNKLENTQIILPATDLLNQNDYIYGAGLYPDRLIAEIPINSEIDYFEKLTVIIENVEKSFYSKIKKHFDNRLNNLFQKKQLTTEDKKDKKKLEQICKNPNRIEQYMKNYFRFYFIEKEIEKSENPIFKLNEYLDTLELQENYNSIELENINYINNFLYFINGSFLFKDAFGNDPNKKKRFESLFEISAREFLQKEDIIKLFEKDIDKGDKKHQDKILDSLKNKYKDEFKTCHKYIAIIQADGDAVGEAIKEIYFTDKNLGLQKFSKDLLDFAKEATEIIHKYGGAPIYAGGDDLLFFAPVRNIIEDKTTHIFELLNNLDTKFKTKFPSASLSFGLSISYYKYPMQEALEEAFDLMKFRAKKLKIKLNGEEKEKNAIAFKVLKHSGQYFDAIFHKTEENKTYKEFTNLLKSRISDNKFLNSLPQKILANKEIITKIGNDNEKVKNYIKNNFNEVIHKTKSYQNFLYNLGNLIVAAFEEYPNKTEEDISEAINIIYSSLRMVKFINRKDNE